MEDASSGGMGFLLIVSKLRVICGLLSRLILGCWHGRSVLEGGLKLGSLLPHALVQASLSLTVYVPTGIGIMVDNSQNQ